MKKNIILEKSYSFALKIIDFHKLLKSKRNYDIGKQILRSGTSIGANIQEAQGAQSTKDFIHKLSIAYKEVRETHYWIRLITDSKIIEYEGLSSLLEDCIEMEKIISSSILTLKAKIENP